MWVGGLAVGLYDNNAILNSVDVVVEVGVERGKKCGDGFVNDYHR